MRRSSRLIGWRLRILRLAGTRWFIYAMSMGAEFTGSAGWRLPKLSVRALWIHAIASCWSKDVWLWSYAKNTVRAAQSTWSRALEDASGDANCNVDEAIYLHIGNPCFSPWGFSYKRLRRAADQPADPNEVNLVLKSVDTYFRLEPF